MKKIYRFLTNRLVCLFFLSSSILIMIFVSFNYNIRQRTFSNIMYDKPIWFGIFGCVTGFGSFFGLMRVADKANFVKPLSPTKKRLRVFFLSLNSLACVSVMTIGFVFDRSKSGFIYDLSKSSIRHEIHMNGSIVYAVGFASGLAGIIALKLRQSKLNTIALVVLVVVAAISTSLIFAVGISAFRQFVGMIPAIMILWLFVLFGPKHRAIAKDKAYTNTQNLQK